MSNTWIKLTDRRPAAEGFPIMLGCDMNGWSEAFCRTHTLWLLAKESGWTHYFPLGKVPERPVEKTQAEVDQQAFDEWYYNRKPGAHRLEAWRAALRYERTCIRAIIERNDLCELTKLEMIKGRVA